MGPALRLIPSLIIGLILFLVSPSQLVLYINLLPKRVMQQMYFVQSCCEPTRARWLSFRAYRALSAENIVYIDNIKYPVMF